MRMSFGEALRVTLFGSSHGPEVGAVVEGLPPGLPIDLPQLQAELDRRRPVGRRLATRRAETDQLILPQGIAGGRTTGEPVVGYVRNEDVRRGPYRPLEDIPRPGHADYPARERYDGLMDLSGGGIFSGRMTVGLVLAGALVRPYLTAQGVRVIAFTRSIHGISVPEGVLSLPLPELQSAMGGNELGAPDAMAAQAMTAAIEEARRAGDSVGGIIEARAEGLPPGVGEPFFDSLEGSLAHALFAIPAIKGVEFGSGFAAAGRLGSENNDPFVRVDGRVRTRTNHAGGILGGLSTGMPLVLRVVVKPTSSIARAQDSISLSRGTPERLVVTGRHDPCIVPRAVPVVEHVTAFVLADFLLRRGRS
jgi:chorismate synthase